MSTILEVKEEMAVVSSVGDFANALQQIAAMRMTVARKKVLTGRRFVEVSEQVLDELKELKAIADAKDIADIKKSANKHTTLHQDSELKAVIVVTSDQGLNGNYNQMVYKKVQEVVDNKDDKYPGFGAADYFIIGKKGQEYLRLGKIKVKYFPYALPENFEMKDLERLTKLFRFYTNMLIIYPKYINTTAREIQIISLLTPPEVIAEDTNIYKDKKHKQSKEDKSANGPKVKKDIKQIGFQEQDIKFIFEPSLDDLIKDASEKLRGAVIRQEILDARLAHYSSQMVGMKAASDNAIELNNDLKKEYNKIRRKMIDKKIAEVFAGINH